MSKGRLGRRGKKKKKELLAAEAPKAFRLVAFQ
jgi:hypothetical protein